MVPARADATYVHRIPICSMYGKSTNMRPKHHPNVGKYTIHGAYRIDHAYVIVVISVFFFMVDHICGDIIDDDMFVYNVCRHNIYIYIYYIQPHI